MKYVRAACVSARIDVGMAITILKTKQTWKRPPPVIRKNERLDQLNDEQRPHVGATMRVLKSKLGSWKALAVALRISVILMNRLAQGRAKPTAGQALRLASLAEVPVEDVLSGKFARGETCPHCGQVMPVDRR